MKKNKLPVEENFRIPAEWEKHEATWLGWPHNKDDWPGKFSTIPFVYAEMIKKISEGEKVRILIEDKKLKKRAEKILTDSDVDISQVEFYIKQTDRNWLRDSGPAFVKNKNEVAAVNFNFNGWAKYDNHKKDNTIPDFISKKINLNKFDSLHNNRNVVLEGGSIDINGKGTLVTTEECLMDQEVQTRNPGFSKKDYEGVFQNYLGIKNVWWLGKGIKGDDTHGHVDDLCRFVDEKTVVIVQEDNINDSNYKILNENRERLDEMKLEDGSKPLIIELPMPSPVIFRGERLPASYANFYISNSAVLVPTFNDPNDRIALGILSEIFTDRKVTGIYAVDLVWGLGTVHCLTHEQPGL